MKKDEVEIEHNKILGLIKSIRDSFPDATIIYTFGACYGFHKILKTACPDAKPYVTKDNGHIVTEINKRFYDIGGEYCDTFGNPIRFKTSDCLSEAQKRRWEVVVCGQRVELMLQKYNDFN